MNKTMIMTVIAVIGLSVGGVIAIALLQQKSENPSVTNKTNREIALTCTSGMATPFHIHPTLQIIVNGVTQPLPANIGVQPTCMTSLHTHDTSGTIHIESPEKRDFTIGDFFAVWKQPFSKDKLMNNTADATRSITVTVNGKQVDTYENTVMNDGDKIVITYGNK